MKFYLIRYRHNDDSHVHTYRVLASNVRQARLKFEQFRIGCHIERVDLIHD